MNSDAEGALVTRFPYPTLAKIVSGFACALATSGALAQALPDSAATRDFLADKATLEQGSQVRTVPNSLLVRFRSGVSRAEQDGIINAMGGQRVRNFGLVEGLVHLRVPQNAARAVQALSANPRVQYAELDGVQSSDATTIPDDPGFSLQWGLYNTGQVVNGSVGTSGIDIRMPEAWQYIAGSSNCLVAVIDSGVQWNHPDFAYTGGSNIWSNDDITGDSRDNDNNGFIDDARGWDFYANDNNPTDENGHGTHVAGIIAAAGNNGVGVAGTAWACKIMPLRFLNRNGSGATSDAIAALNYAVAEGARVSNNSWGGGGYSQALSDAIQAAGVAGHTFVAAAGNNGINIDSTPNYPAAYPNSNILTVAAVDANGNLASFSNTGINSVDIAAPGVNIFSTYFKSGYAYLNGTSMATPFVSGTVGLLASQLPSATPDTLIARIVDTGTPDARYAGKIRSGSMLDAGYALAMITIVPTEPVALPVAPSGFTGINNNDGSATLSWASNDSSVTSFRLEREKQNKNGSWGAATLLNLPAETRTYRDNAGTGSFRYRLYAVNSAGQAAAITVSNTTSLVLQITRTVR